MAKLDARRQTLFDRYSNHLHYLKSQGRLPSLALKYPKTYICPICIGQCSEADLKPGSLNPLTLEDAPPDSLGGSKVVLTCKKCNNTCGHEIDFHLAQRMIEIDNRLFLPGSTMKLKFAREEGNLVNGMLFVEEDGTMRAQHHIKRNNPKVLDEYIKGVKPDTETPSITVQHLPSKFDERRFAYGLLKSAYILTFAKFGYSFLLESVYDRIRYQLLNPQLQVYPIEFYTEQPFPEQYEGVNVILEKDYEGIFPIFSLKTKASTRRYGVYIPNPGTSVDKMISTLGQKGPGFHMLMHPVGGDYLFNIDLIDDLLLWQRKSLARSLGL